jgi:hypothetical protein
MEMVSKLQRWNRLRETYHNGTWLVLLAGLGLVVALGILATLNPLLAVMGGIAILLFALVHPRPILIVYALTVLLPLTGGMSRGGVVPFLRVGQAILVLGFILFMLAKPSCQGKTRLTSIDLVFALFLITEAVFPILSLYYRGDHINLGASDMYGSTPLQTLLGPVQYYLLYRIVVATVSSEKQIKMVLKFMFIASIIVSIIGILEELGVGPVKTFLEVYYPIPLTSSSYYEGSNLRIASTLQHYSGLGAYLSFTIILVLACYLAQEQLKISPLLLGTTLLFDSITLVLSGTFAAWIGLMVGAIVIFIVGRRLPRTVLFILFGITVAVIIFYPFISSRLDFELGKGETQGLLPESFAYRVMLWKDFLLPALSEHLIFGAGPAPQVVLDAGQAIEESQYFYLLLEGGLSYFFAYFLLIGVAVAACWHASRSKSKDINQAVAIGLLAILVAINVMNVSGEYFTYVGGTQTLWTLLAIVVASRQIKSLEPAAATEPMRNNQWRAGFKTLRMPLSKEIPSHE